MKRENIFAEYLDHMGSDLTVVNAARASFGKESEWATRYTTKEEFAAGAPLSIQELKAEDRNLIRFLATGYRTKEWDDFLGYVITLASSTIYNLDERKEALTKVLHGYKRKAQHWAPFAHPHVQIRISIPIFLARQFVKHQIGGTWSEESRRYISDEPGVWFPEEWHTRPEDIKQGSGSALPVQAGITHIAERTVGQALSTYEAMLDMKVAPEEARCVLPLNMMTTVVWTGSLLFWSRVCNQRVDSHAQLAAQELGKLISGIVEPLFPESWKALTQ